MQGVTGENILATALALMDEEPTADYESRALPLINTLIAQCYTASLPYNNNSPSAEGDSRSGFVLLESLSGEIEGFDRALVLSAFPFGLAALLYLDEDDKRADSFWQIFQEQVQMARRMAPNYFEEIGGAL